MDSESAAFSTEGSFLSVLIILAVFVATVCVAMVLVLARRSCLAAASQPDEDHVPPTRLGSVVDVRRPTELFPQTRQEQAAITQNWVMHLGVTAEADGLKRAGSFGRGRPETMFCYSV